MTNTGKNLQAIYNNGSKKLIEIENLVQSELISQGQTEIHKFKKSQDSFSSLVEDQYTKLESELNNACEKSLKNFEQLVHDEYVDIKEHLDGLKHQVNHLTKHLQDKLNDFKLEKQDILQKNELTCKNEIGNVHKKKSIEIEKQGFGTIKHLRNHATNSINLLQQKLDSSLWESRSMEKNVNSTFFKTYMQKASGIETHFSNLIQQLNTELQNNYKILEQASSQHEDELKNVEAEYINKINDKNENLLGLIDEASQNSIDKFTNKLNKLLDNYLKEAYNEMKIYSEDLDDLSKMLNSEINMQNKDSQDLIKDKCNNLQSKIGPTKKTFLIKLNNRVNSSKNIQEELRNEHDLLFSRIKSELANIHTECEEKMEKLMAFANEKLDSVTSDTEKEIMDFQQKYSIELLNVANSAKNDVNNSVNELVDLIYKYKEAALKLMHD